MTELLEQALDRARTLPDDLQDEIARMVLSIAEAAARGEFATDDQLRAVRAKHGS